MKDIVIIGAGGFGREIAWLIEEINETNKEWNLLGFLDEDTKKHGKLINGYKVLGDLNYFKDKKEVYYVCAIGNSKVKRMIIEKCSEYYMIPATLIHPSVMMCKKSNRIGQGTVICAGSILTVDIHIGNHVIINLDCTIGHDVRIKDYVTIYPSVNVSGNCLVEEGVELGSGTVVIQGKKIGSNAIVGAGSVVIADIVKESTAVGVPAKVIKTSN